MSCCCALGKFIFSYVVTSETWKTPTIYSLVLPPHVYTAPRGLTSCSAVALCPVTSLHIMMCSSRITWKEDKIGLQSSTGGERGMSTQGTARKMEEMLTPGLDEGFISLSGWVDRLIASSGDQSIIRVRNPWRDMFSTLNNHNPVTCSKTPQTPWVVEILMFPKRMRQYDSLRQSWEDQVPGCPKWLSSCWN